MREGIGIINSRAERFFFFCLCFLLGIAAGNFFIFDHFFIFCLILISILGLIFCWSKKFLAFVLLCWLGFLLGFWRFELARPDFNDPGKIYHYHFQEVVFTGQIINIDQRISHQKLTVATGWLLAANSRRVTGKVLINAPLWPAGQIFDRVKVTCWLKPPGQIEDFDYGRYLSVSGIYSLCERAVVSPTSGPLSWRERGIRFIFSFKQILADRLNQVVSEPEASVLQAMLLGDRGGLEPEWLEKFSRLGLTHIVAISGSHISIISAVLMSLLLGLGLWRRQALGLVIVVIVVYVFIIGAPASAVRSAVMGVIFLLAQNFGRLSNTRNLLVFTAAVMCLANPVSLLADVGFQLSFAAVLGLIYLFPILKKFFTAWPELWQIKEMLLLTFSAQIFTLPLIAFYFQKFSLIFFLANILILPVIPFLTIWGLLNLLVAAVSVTLGQALGWVSWLITAYWLTVTAGLSVYAGGFNLMWFNLWWVGGSYVMLAAVIFWFNKKRSIIDL